MGDPASQPTGQLLLEEQTPTSYGEDMGRGSPVHHGGDREAPESMDGSTGKQAGSFL